MSVSKSHIGVGEKVRYVVTEDTVVKQNKFSNHWKLWVFMVVVVASVAFGYFGIVQGWTEEVVEDFTAEVVEDFTAGAAVGSSDTVVLDVQDQNCNAYEELVVDCSEIDQEEIEDNGCAYYFEITSVDEKYYASACTGAVACVTNNDCEVLLDDSEEVVQLLDDYHGHHPGVNRSHGVSSHSHHPNVTHGAHRHNVSNHAHHPNFTHGGRAIGGMANVDDCSEIVFSELGDTWCGDYYELEEINDEDVTYVCSCTGTDSCFKSEDCQEVLE